MPHLKSKTKLIMTASVNRYKIQQYIILLWVANALSAFLQPNKIYSRIVKNCRFQLSRIVFKILSLIFSFAVQNNSTVMWSPWAENQQTSLGSLLIHPSPITFSL